jgi:general secretion pathway protein D
MTTRSRILLTSLLTVASAMAQQRPPVVRPGGGQVPTPPTPTAQPATATAPENTQPLAERISQDGWTEPKINGEDLAMLYTQVTGRRVTVSNAAISAEFRFVQPGPLSYGEAAELLKVAAITEGFVFVPSANIPNHDTLVVASQGLNPKQIGLPVYTSESELPEGDQVVTYVMTLKYIKPDDIVKTFTQVVGQFTTSGAIAAVPNASSVIITENTALIRSLIQLQKTIDVTPQTVATRFLKVQYADVTELAETLNTVLDTKGQNGKTTPTQRVATTPNPGNPNAGAAATGEGGTSLEEVPIQIVPDARTNRIFAMGRPIDIAFAEGLIREFDTPSDQRNYLRRKLSFVTVSDFLDVAEQALTRAFSGTGGAGGTAGNPSGANFGSSGGASRTGSTSGARTSTSSTRTSGSSSSSGFGSSSSGFGSSGSSGFGSSSTGSSGSSSGGLQAQNVNTAPQARLVGRTLLVADNITNSIVVQGPPASLEIVEKLLDEIDVKPDQVMISCVFGQLSLTDGYNFGIDYSRALTTGDSGGFAGTGGSGGVATFPSSGTYTNALNPVSGGLGLYGLIGRNMNIYLEAKQNDSNFKVLSRPTIFTANNQMGQITSGTQIAIPTNSYTSTSSSSSSTNYEYKSVDLTLQVIPLVNSDKEITLQIYLTSNDIGSDRTVGTGDSSYKIPDILNRELITTVTVPNDQTIVLGGLITSSDKKTRTGIPILNRLPLLGPLFGTDAVSKDRSELLVFIQPKIVRNTNTMGEAQQDINGRYKVQNAGKEFINGAQQPAPEPHTTLAPRAASQRPTGYKGK